jgi:hypothetical protein
MADFFHLDLPVVRVPKIDYAASLNNADPEAMKEQRGSIYPEEPLPIRPGAGFTPTRDLASVLPASRRD